MSRAKNIFIAFDQLLNTIFSGYPDETLCSRAYRWERSGKRAWPRKLIDTIFFWDKKHCYESYLSERLGRQLPPELRPENF